MAQCLVTFAVISPIEPSLPITVDGIMDPGLPPHTPYLGTPVVFPPGQRPVSFCFWMVFAKYKSSNGKLYKKHHLTYNTCRGSIAVSIVVMYFQEAKPIPGVQN